ncbi:hypothetical protein Q1695_011177 [Nippostrongylus brasiliensis]|nr:hypothetical protein Q1695_011177 [Nippostrongylus brasiliensis]
MAFSDEQELIDQIRHELRMEDDSGTCSRVVAPERRRAKHGGLPLNFRVATSSDDDDGDRGDFDEYEIPMSGDDSHTKQIIEERLSSRIGDSCDVEGSRTVSNNQKTSEELFVSQEVAENAMLPDHRSAISRFIAENGSSANNPLLSYAKFEAIDQRSSKTILVLLAIDDQSDDDIPRLKISVHPTAKVDEVIGYCLYRAYTDFGLTASGSVNDYQLLMADDSGEIESDLPPLDRARSIGDLGFTVLALVPRRKTNNGDENTSYRIVVYLPSGARFVFEFEHLDHTLEWLRDETLRRKREEEPQHRKSKFLQDMEYELEDVNIFGKPLNLQQSISNSGCYEFILVRKFSSRGEFHPRGAMYRQKSTALLTPVSRSSNSPFEFPNQRLSPAETPSASTEAVSPFVFCEDEEVLLSFRVTRLHRVKKNWQGIMSIRWNLFDVVPVSSQRKSFLPSTYQKPLAIPWTILCDVRQLGAGEDGRKFSNCFLCWARRPSVDDDHRASAEQSSILVFTWLPLPDKESVPTADEITLRHIAQLYENRKWKMVMMNFESAEKAQQACEHMVGVVRALGSPTYQAYQHSNGGARGPSESAESALMEMADGLLPAPFRPPKTSAMKRLTRLRRALTTKWD